MKQINKYENSDAKFDLYFLAYDSPNSAQPGSHLTARQGLLELTHNYGTENDDNYKVANGNSEPGKGFGHICISVDAIQAACQRIEDAGYKFRTYFQSCSFLCRKQSGIASEMLQGAKRLPISRRLVWFFKRHTNAPSKAILIPTSTQRKN